MLCGYDSEDGQKVDCSRIYFLTLSRGTNQKRMTNLVTNARDWTGAGGFGQWPSGKEMGRLTRVRAGAEQKHMMTALQEQSKTSIGKAILT